MDMLALLVSLIPLTYGPVRLIVESVQNKFDCDARESDEADISVTKWCIPRQASM
jgi:hypothetical protein